MDYNLIIVLILLVFFSLTSLYLLRKEREKSKKSSEKFQSDLYSLLDAWKDVNIYQIDRFYKYVNFNGFHKNEMKRVFGADIQSGQNKLMLLPVEIRKQYQSLYDKGLAGEEVDHTHRFGADYLRFQVIPNFNSVNKVKSITVLATNITDRVKHEKELEAYRAELELLVEKRSENILAQRNFFLQIIDQIQSSIFVRNARGEYTLANMGFVHEMGYKDRSEVIGRTIFDVHPVKAKAEMFFQEDADILENDSVFSNESLKEDKRGKLWFFLTKKRVEVGGEKQVLGVQTDITYLKDTQFALENTNQELKNALEDVKNFQLKLIESEKLATIGQLTAGLIHEINNPINFVAGNIGPIKLDLEDIKKWVDESPIAHQKPELVQNTFNEVETLLQGIEEGASRVKSLMQSLKTLSRPDSSETTFFNINSGIKSSLELISPKVKDRISFDIDLGEVEDIQCNPGQIQQVFLGILDNAIDAIENNGVILIKSFKKDDLNKVIISDDGKGISQEDQIRVFEPFFTTKEFGHGTGLGLAIARRIIKEHGGSISLDSVPGKGTNVSITIPY